MPALSQNQRIVIIGGGYAGLLAAARAAQARTRAEIVLLDAQPNFAERIRWHEILAGSPARTLAYGPLLARRGVRFVQARVTALDPQTQQLQALDHNQQSLNLGYDYLVVALGSRVASQVPGVAAHTLPMNDLATIAASHARLRALAQRGGRVLIVGAGLTGIETATELAERMPGLQISLIAREQFGAGYADQAVAYLRTRLAQLRITLLEHTSVSALEPQVAHTSRGAIAFDACIWSGGFEAAPLARNAGLAVDDAGRMLVDPWLRARDYSNIFAVGDAAAANVGHMLRMGCVSAIPMGAHAGTTVGQLIQGRPAKPFSMAFTLRCVSLGRSAGLVQWTRPDDSPVDRVWTKRRAAWTKELICRMTFMVVRNELRWGVPLYRWPQSIPQPTHSPLLEDGA